MALLSAGLALLLLGACGDGPDPREGNFPVGRPTSTRTAVPKQEAGAFMVPCELTQFIQTTPRLPYEVKVTDDKQGLVSLSGVLVSACMGATGQEKKVATEVLGKGIQTWLEATYPKGTTVTDQIEFEAKVCMEVARLVSATPVLAKVSWVALATHGTFTMELKPVTGNETPPAPPGNYSDPGCKLPRTGPTA